ncbi:hypothetical protein UFOVP961_26 [uncultured Caudovirales phage]|uniref:SpoVT-AbrB domain-containing protein n=1 Tax=uncultured Caudovirales phage TaxID=2100421 RepID=A0A6J7XH80_9CAUD|nr:hypothetical protein UFOVP961_26 [uncultured Caudovirales phage]CAB4185557.1 hypothetical protein UFOVP1123_96 [uncultured Caudovirales phage]CAB4193286.1 hypothetical protein UFOVP1239_54 [uncultured Caudovirales phage]CAB4216158.1 hypothetical protein UFOVP1484_100 [uncultured Caudovirales phage]CAB5230784.1 hypothetical protein UFOVP1577_106 [uncultured Caudovirales phage]
MKKRIVTLQDDHKSGDVILPLPKDLLEEMDWKEGDTLDWKDNKDGSFSLSKKQKEITELVLVECIQAYRMRYLVEVPKGQSEWALDTVVMNEAKEFSQKPMEEILVSHRVVTKKEALNIFDVDNDYLVGWTEQQKLDVCITHWKESDDS